jgi:regulator of sigma E protease
VREAILAIFLLGVLVSFHELGHFLAGRRSGVYVHEFAIGMGPTVFSWQKGETKFSIRLIPLGGYNRFAGEDGRDSEDESHVPEERRISAQPPAKKAFILFSGPLANLIIASVAFFLVFSFVGINTPTTTLAEIMPGYPAEQAGIQTGDKVLKVEGLTVDSWDDLTAAIQPRSGKETSLTLQRGTDILEVSLVPIEVSGTGMIGIRPSFVISRMNPLQGLYQGFKETLVVSVLWLQGILGMIAGTVAPEVTGPVGITQILGEAAKTGLGELVYLFGALSANLGLMNLMPIPALDGSRLLFTGLEAIRGKPIDPEKEGLVHFVGFFLLISLFAVITYKDILRLIR